MKNVKITEVKKVDNRDLFGDNPPVCFTPNPVCDKLEVGQEFIFVEKEGSLPPGFCPWALNDIYKDILHLLLGGDFPWIKEKGTTLSCCTDGIRPVIFKLERIED
ncbi:TIGR04076 family protein [Chloroflexota bacterium]